MLRQTLSALPRRLFSTSAARRDGVPDAFADLARITSSGPSSLSSSSSSFLSASPLVDPTTQRGYVPNALPAKVDPVLELFTNVLMRHGKKAQAQTHVAAILTQLQRATNQPPAPLLRRAIELSAPSFKVLSMRKHAKTIMTPRALDERQRTRMGINFLLKAAERGRKSGIRRDDRVAREVLAVLEGTSDVFKRIEEVHRSATLNRSNLHAR